MRVRGDGVEVDLTGSSPQVPTAFNVPFDGSTKVACYFAFRALLLDTYTHQRIHPSERGLVSACKGHGAARLHLQPYRAGRRGSALQPDPARRRPDHQGDGAGLPDKCTAGNAAVLSFAAYSGVRPNGDYWVFLEVNEAAMGGRPMSDGPDTIEELMRNTRNNPLEDLGMHLPLICDRYEVRDDVPPGAGKFRGGAGVVKSQRYLTPGFMTHESDRHEDAPWGIFGGKPGHGGKVELSNDRDRQGRLISPRSFPGLRTDGGRHRSPTTRRSAEGMAIRWSATRKRCWTTCLTALSPSIMRATTTASCLSKSTTDTGGPEPRQPPGNCTRKGVRCADDKGAAASPPERLLRQDRRSRLV